MNFAAATTAAATTRRAPATRRAAAASKAANNTPEFLEKSMIGITPNGANMIYSAPYGYVALVSDNEYKIIKLANKYHIPTLRKIYELNVKDDTTSQNPIIRKGLPRTVIGPGNFFIDKLFTFYDKGEYTWTMGVLPHGETVPSSAIKYTETNNTSTGYSSQIISIKFNKSDTWLTKTTSNIQTPNNYVHINNRQDSFFNWSPDMSSTDFEDFQEKDVGNKKTLYGSFYLNWTDNLKKLISQEGKNFINIFETAINEKLISRNSIPIENYAFIWQRKLGIQHKDSSLCEYLTKIEEKSAAVFATEGTSSGFQNTTLPDMLGRIVHMVFIFNNDNFWKWSTGNISRINYGFLIYQIYLTILGFYEMDFVLDKKTVPKYKFSIKQSVINSILCQNNCILSSLPLYKSGQNNNIWNGQSFYYKLLSNLRSSVGNVESFQIITQDTVDRFSPKSNASNKRNDILWTFISHGEMIVNLCKKSPGNTIENTVAEAQQYANQFSSPVTILGDTHHIAVFNCTPWFLYFNENNGYTSQHTSKAIKQLTLSNIAKFSRNNKIRKKKLYLDKIIELLLNLRNGPNPSDDFFSRTPDLRTENLQQLAEMDETDIDPNNAKGKLNMMLRMEQTASDTYYTKNKDFRSTIKNLIESHDEEENASKKKKIRKNILKKLKQNGITDITSWAKNEICKKAELHSISERKKARTKRLSRRPSRSMRSKSISEKIISNKSKRAATRKNVLTENRASTQMNLSPIEEEDIVMAKGKREKKRKGKQKKKTKGKQKKKTKGKQNKKTKGKQNKKKRGGKRTRKNKR